MPFRLACVQFHPEMGKVKHNLDRMAEIVRQAVGEEGADLVAFPETSVSGYYVQGGACDVAMEPDEVRDGLAERLSGLGSHVDVLAGFYRKSSGEPFNSAGWFSFAPDAKTVAVYDKFFLATYTVFDEDRYVSRGRELGVFDTRFGKVGLLICEDTWHSILGTLLALHGAQIVFSLIASPGRGFQGKVPSNVDRYDRMLRAIAEEHGVYAASANMTGFEGGKGLVGGSVIYDPTGERLAMGDVMEEHMVVADVDFEKIRTARAKMPLLADLQASWDTISRIAKI